MKLLEKLARWWNSPCVDLNHAMEDVEVLRRRWGGFNVNPRPTHARPPVPPGPPPTFSQQRLQEVNAALQAAGRAFGGYQPIDRGVVASPPPKDPSGFKLNAERSVAVATDYFWNKDMATCPRGVKVQLLGRGGVAVYGNYSGSDFWTAWAPCPKRR